MRLFEVVKEENIDTKLEYHDQLNPKIWKTEDKIKPAIRKDLLKIAKLYGEYINVKSSDIKDVIVTGSNANYNWSDLSDIDLHLVIDTSSIECDVLEDFLKTKKSLWAEMHNITINGYNVELYAQPQKDPLSALGVYSLEKDEWIKKPIKKKIDLSDPHIKTKAAEYMNAIDSLCSNEHSTEKSITALGDKISKMRKIGLQKNGEFSIENLVFKTLRNNGYLDKLWNTLNSRIDNNLSL